MTDRPMTQIEELVAQLGNAYAALAAAVARAESAEAQVERMREAGENLRRCANAILGAQTGDPDAEEAFDAFMVSRDNWRKAARAALEPKP